MGFVESNKINEKYLTMIKKWQHSIRNKEELMEDAADFKEIK